MSCPTALLPNTDDCLDSVPAWSLLTSSRVFVLTGPFAQKMAMTPLSKITEIRIQRSRFARFIGYGTLIFELADKEQKLRKINYVPYPETLFMELSDLLFPADEEEGSET